MLYSTLLTQLCINMYVVRIRAYLPYPVCRIRLVEPTPLVPCTYFVRYLLRKCPEWIGGRQAGTPWVRELGRCDAILGWQGRSYGFGALQGVEIDRVGPWRVRRKKALRRRRNILIGTSYVPRETGGFHQWGLGWYAWYVPKYRICIMRFSRSFPCVPDAHVM